VTPEFAAKFRPAVCCTISVFLIFGTFWSVRLAQADYDSVQPDPAAVARACQLAPGAANYWLRAAALDPTVDAGLEKALALNPRYTDASLARAVRYETQGRIAEAEREYLAAAKVDHMYKPLWALANFYVRQGQDEKFWIYAISYSFKPRAIYDLFSPLSDR